MRSRRNSRVRRVVIVVLVLVGGGNLLDKSIPKAYSDTVRIVANVDGSAQGGGDYYTIVNLGHEAGATEGFDGSHDSPYAPPMPKNIGVFSEISDSPDKLSIDMRGPNSTTDYKVIVETIGNNIGGDQWWMIDLIDANGSEWKNIFIERYGKNANLADPNITPLAIWDVIYKDGKGYFQNGYLPTQDSGIADQLKEKIFNLADLNRDKRVNLKDYAIFANNFGRNDPNCGADANNLDDYSDIDRSGVIDFNDLSIFSDEWLWDANDPNTW